MVLKAKSKIRLNIVLNALQKESEGEAQKRQFLLVAPLNSTVQELKRRILTMANQVSQEKLKRFNQVASSTPIHKKKLLFIEKEIKIST